MKKKLTPQQKKVLSYVRDGRNLVARSFNASGAAARFSVKRRKKKASRALRKAERMNLESELKRNDDPNLHVARIGRRTFKKIPDAPLEMKVSARQHRAGVSSSLRREGHCIARSKRSISKSLRRPAVRQ